LTGGGIAACLSYRPLDTETFMAKLTKEQIMVRAEMVRRGTSIRQVARQLREENRRLKQLVADLSVDNSILHEALRKKW
jgi:hypothetical protein